MSIQAEGGLASIKIAEHQKNFQTHYTRPMENKELWKSALGEIELQISRPNFLTWMKNSELLAKNEKEGIAFVGLPNNFAKEWVKNRYHKIILGSLRNLDTSIKHVNYTVLNQAATFIKTAKIKPLSPQASLVEERTQIPLAELKVDPVSNLNPRYTLELFVVGSSNELAHAAILAVIKDVGTKYNPLFIYGGTGVGKTHLIQSAGNAIQKEYAGKIKVLYTTSEKFVNDVVWSVKNKRMEDMKRKYRNVDVLIVDDIQFIGGKPATEMEFFHTFNALHENNKQIIISSDRPPAAIATLEERLRSRFQASMVADIQYPEYEMRLAILKTKTQEKGWTIPEKTLEHIASKVQRSIRELEGVLNKIVFYQQYKRADIDMKKLDEMITETSQISAKNISAGDVIRTVADFFEVPVSDLTERSRKQEIVEPRQIAMFLLRDMLKLSYPHIGEKLGKRDHTTAIHAYEKIAKETNQNPGLNQKIMLIKERLYRS